MFDKSKSSNISLLPPVAGSYPSLTKSSNPVFTKLFGSMLASKTSGSTPVNSKIEALDNS